MAHNSFLFMSHTKGTGIFLTVLMLVIVPGWAAGGDLHRMWDDRCSECHGHAGAFARRSLNVVEGELQGRHHVHDLKRFLSNHYLAENEVDAVHDMLLAQAVTEPRFRSNCSGCHDTAAEFVRSSIELRDGVSYGRRSGKKVIDFLREHQGLHEKEIDFYVEVLTRVAREVHRQ